MQPFTIFQLIFPNFCQDFSKNLDYPKRFDGKSRGEICQFSPLKLPNFYPKFAVKLGEIYK